MVGWSDFGGYSRSLLILRNRWDRPMGIQDTQQPLPPPSDFVSIAFDVGQRMWVCRGQNWKAARSGLLGCVSGAAYKETLTANLILETGRGKIIINQYWKDDSPRREGAAYLGAPDPRTQQFQNVSHWWRYDDPVFMTPMDRLGEMLDRALRSPKLRARLQEQAGGLVSVEVILPLAGTFLAMFGAEFVGGAALVWMIGKVLDINQWACDIMIYEPLCRQLHTIAMNATRPEQLDEGADLLQEILIQLITDVAASLAIQSLVKAAGRLFAALLDAGPEAWRNTLLQSRARATAYISGKKYERMELLKDPHGTPLEDAAVEMYKKTSAENCEVLVVREPDAQRSIWVKAKSWVRAKPPWLTAKSYNGWNGLVAIRKADVPDIGALTMVISARTDWTGNLRGVSREIDALLDQRTGPPAIYEMPTENGAIKDGIYYNAAGAKGANLKGHYLVDMGDGKLVITDALGVPYASDLDLATRQRPGMSQAGDHLPERKIDENGLASEDDVVAQYKMNATYHQHPDANPAHDPNLHGGGGATTVYTRNNLAKGKKPGDKGFWSPQDGKGGYKDERLVVFLPRWKNGRMGSDMFVFNGWGDFELFAAANRLEFPFNLTSAPAKPAPHRAPARLSPVG